MPYLAQYILKSVSEAAVTLVPAHRHTVSGILLQVVFTLQHVWLSTGVVAHKRTLQCTRSQNTNSIILCCGNFRQFSSYKHLLTARVIKSLHLQLAVA